MVEGRVNLPTGGVARFSADNNSSNAAETSREKYSGNEYFAQGEQEEEENQELRESPFVDRSAQLNATLNSLAMMNVAGLIKKNNPNNPAPNKKD